MTMGVEKSRGSDQKSLSGRFSVRVSLLLQTTKIDEQFFDRLVSSSSKN